MRYKQRKSLVLAATAAAMAAAGCGGGSGGGSAATSQAHTVKSGNAVITYLGQPKPQLTTSSAAVSVVGQAGATFSTVTLEPPPNLDDTYLTFGRSTSAGPYVVEELHYGDYSPTLLYQNDGAPQNPAISAYGTVAFQNNQTLESIRPDGTGLKSLSFAGMGAAQFPSYSVDGSNRLAFFGYNGNWNLCVAPGAGGSPTILQTSTASLGFSTYSTTWNAAGTQVAFTADAVGDNYSGIYTSGTTTGTTPVNVTPDAYRVNYSFFSPCWSPDGVTVLANAEAAGGNVNLVTFNVNSQLTAFLTPGTYSDGNGCFSPDGSKIAFYRSFTGGATPGIYVCEADGENQQLMCADPTGSASFAGISWSPFLPKETVVAASGSTFYHQAASGILLSQTGSQFGSVVAFTATTPADAAIQAATPTTGTAPLEFTLTADSITSIGYINSYFSPGTTITLSGTPSAVVSIDATTGQVDLVAPLSVAKPSVVRNGDGTLTYKGAFKALYDGKGKNIAPNGASQVIVDTKTGRLVSWG